MLHADSCARVSTSSTSSTSGRSPWKASRYNLLVAVEGGGGAVYNGATGACLDSEADDDFRRISRFLTNESGIDFDLLDDRAVELGGALLAGGFLVDTELDELESLRERGRSAKTGGPLVMTINPTFACNLDCGYCFVGKKQGSMSIETEREVIRFVARNLESQDLPGVEIDWFGGEPLIASKTIERVSEAVIELCAAKSVPFSAQVISNGTLLTPELADRLTRCGVNRIQITIDGAEHTHDKRRPWKVGKRVTLPVLGATPTRQRSSFEDALRGVEAAIGRFAVRLRINVDRNNLDQAMDLLAMFRERGWLRPELRFYPYLAPVRDYTEASRVHWSIAEDCGTKAFYAVNEQWLNELDACGIPVVKESLYGFPEPRSQPCGAVTSRGWLINDDGSLHKCGFDVDTDGLSVGRLGDEASLDNANMKFWTGYDHFSDPTCRDCRALPLCLGGCARDRREKRAQAMSENCEYHLEHEPRILAQHIRLARKHRAARRHGAGSHAT